MNLMFTTFMTANDIPSQYFEKKAEINGVVVHVVDGDTVRIRHMTTWFSDSTFVGPLSQNTIIVRLAAVDAPELGKGNKSGQPFAEEAANFVSANLKGKKVCIKLLAKDQYGRVLGRVTYRKSGMFIFRSSKRDISEQLLKKGLAVVYRGGGARYDGGVDQWNQLEQLAVEKKRGMWARGRDSVQLPSQFKEQSRRSNGAGTKIGGSVSNRV